MSLYLKNVRVHLPGSTNHRSTRLPCQTRRNWLPVSAVTGASRHFWLLGSHARHEERLPWSAHNCYRVKDSIWRGGCWFGVIPLLPAKGRYRSAPTPQPSISSSTSYGPLRHYHLECRLNREIACGWRSPDHGVFIVSFCGHGDSRYQQKDTCEKICSYFIPIPFPIFFQKIRYSSNMFFLCNWFQR